MDAQLLPTTATTASLRRHAQHPVNEYYARQLMPSPLISSSSYDYWWPYPPGGVAATASPTTFSPTPTNTWWTAPTDTTTPTLALSFESDSAASSSSASDSLNITSISSSTASISSSASESIISISALPPSNTTIPANSNAKISMVPASNLIYIVPICGVVGLLIGGLTTWCVYGCLTRNGHGRRRGRKSYGTLEVGPEYDQPSPRLGEKQEYETGEWVGDQQHAEELDGDNINTLHGSDAGDDDDDDEHGGETEGFLHPGSAQTQTRPTRYTTRTKSEASEATTASTYTVIPRGKSTRGSRAPSPTPSGRTSLFFDRPDSTDAVPWESLRHKSIKRGILERVWGDGQQDRMARRPWQAHARNESDLLVADAQAANANLSRAPSSVTAAVLSRALSSVTASTTPGFRMVTESPAETPQGERGADVFRWPSVQEDRYTRVPERVARSRSRSPEKASRATSPDKRARARPTSPPVRRGGGGGARGRAVDTDTDTDIADRGTDFRSVLPQSPPRISSPVLDGALCFTPIPEATPEMTSFASFGAPSAEREGGWLTEREHAAGGRVFRGADRGRQ